MPSLIELLSIFCKLIVYLLQSRLKNMCLKYLEVENIPPLSRRLVEIDNTKFDCLAKKLDCHFHFILWCKLETDFTLQVRSFK